MTWYDMGMEIFRRIEHGDDEHRRWLHDHMVKWSEEMQLRHPNGPMNSPCWRCSGLSD